MDNTAAFAIWLTGLPASGKSTLANLLAQEISRYGLSVQVLDSDEIRQQLTPEPDYSSEERKWFYTTLVFIGELLVRNGVNVVIAATAHRRAYRQQASLRFSRFVEVYVRCPLNICMQRDQKGLYQKAMNGTITSLPGVQVLYEEPDAPAVIVDTQKNSPQECVEKILNQLEVFAYLPGAS